MWPESTILFGLAETEEQAKNLEMKVITTGDRTFALCKKLYQYFLDQATDMDFSADYHHKLSDFLNICRTVHNKALNKYEPVMFYTTTTKLLSSIFFTEKQPGGTYHDTRAPLLALYHDAGQTKELEMGIEQFVGRLAERYRHEKINSNERIFIMKHVQDVIFSNSPPLPVATPSHRH